MNGTKRAGDRTGFVALWGRYGANLVTLVAVVFAGWAVIIASGAADEARNAANKALVTATTTRQLVLNVTREQRQRIDATCTINETKQRNDVRQLKRLYDYLAGLTSTQRQEPLNRTIIAGLPASVEDAKIDDAPSYCDKPGVGLPEPDPVMPKRPAGLPPG